ncbi:hypothetical protein SNEBB_001575 [Seison nebaliae]|nr:hypothetical protein SNEBB_001575 [Seison nebaliae]
MNKHVNGTEPMEIYYHLEDIIKITLFIAITIANTIVIFRIQLKKKTRMHFFILHLAIADLSVGFFSIGYSIVVHQLNILFVNLHQNHQMTAIIACRIVRSLQVLPLFASPFIVVVVAIDRVFAICHPMYTADKKFRFGLVTGAWLLAVCSTSMIFSFIQIKNHVCDIFTTEFFISIWYTFLLLAVFIVPLIIVVLSYVLIYRNLKKSNKLFLTPTFNVNTSPDYRTTKSIKFNGNKGYRMSKISYQMVIPKKLNGMRKALSKIKNYRGSDQMSQSRPDSELSNSVIFSNSLRSAKGSIRINRISKARIRTVQLTFVIVSAFILCTLPDVTGDIQTPKNDTETEPIETTEHAGEEPVPDEERMQKAITALHDEDDKKEINFSFYRNSSMCYKVIMWLGAILSILVVVLLVVITHKTVSDYLLVNVKREALLLPPGGIGEWFYQPPNPDDPKKTCQTIGCLEVGANMADLINTKVDPCTDFYKYACGKWNNKYDLLPLETEVTQKVLVAEQAYETLKNELESTIIRNTDTSWEKKVKQFYNLCLDDYKAKTTAPKHLMDLIKKDVTAGGVQQGWYLFNEGSSTAIGWSLKAVLDDLMHLRMYLDVEGFFRMNVERSPLSDTKNMLWLEKPTFRIPIKFFLLPFDSPEITLYKNFIKKILTILKTDNNLNPTTFDANLNEVQSDILDVERNLAQIVDKTSNNTIRAYIVNLSSLEKKYLNNSQELRTMLQNYFNSKLITSRTQIAFHSIAYFQELLKYFKTAEPRKLFNYIMWKTVATYISDLGPDYVAAQREVVDKIYNTQDFLGNEYYCFSVMKNNMPEALSKIFIDKKFAGMSKSVLHDISDMIKDSMVKRLTQDAKTWMDKKTLRYAISKIHKIDFKMGYPNFVGSDVALDYHFLNFTVDTKSIFNTLVNHATWRRLRKIDELRNSVGIEEFWENVKPFEVGTVFSRSLQKIFVTAAFMQPNFFKSSWPAVANFATAGTQLAEQLLKSVDEGGRRYDRTGHYLSYSWWTKDTINKYVPLRQCFTDYYKNRTVGPYLVNNQLKKIILHGATYSYQTINHVGALKIAYEAYNNWVANNRLKNVDTAIFGAPSPKQAFFITYAQKFCANRLDFYSYYQTLRGQYEEDLALNAAVSFSNEFQQAFQCSASAKMNAKRKCNIY